MFFSQCTWLNIYKKKNILDFLKDDSDNFQIKFDR